MKRFGFTNTPGSKKQSVVYSIALGLAISVAILLVVMVRFGSARKALAFVGGQRLYIESPSKIAREIPPGRTIVYKYKIFNLSEQVINIIASQSSCSCTMVGNIPQKLEPRQESTIEVQIEVPSWYGRSFQGNVDILTDDARRKTYRLSYSGSTLAGGPAIREGQD
jgi:hypothetical protein